MNMTSDSYYQSSMAMIMSVGRYPYCAN